MTTEHAPADRHARVAEPIGEPAPTPEPDIDEMLAEIAADLVPGRALDLGCGRGHDVIWLARQGDEATIDGSELTVIDNAAVSLDDDAASNEARIDPFDPDRVLALVEGEEGEGDEAGSGGASLSFDLGDG